MKHLRSVLSIGVFAALAASHAGAAQLALTRPFGSVRFGEYVEVLPNGNIVVVDPDAFDVFLEAGGKVHLFRPDGTLISTLSGSQDGDRVGSGGIKVLASGDFLVLSPEWANGSAINAGAVTFVDADSGLQGFVGEANSLVGSHSEDGIGGYVELLANGNYVVASEMWDNGNAVDAGAVTFGNGLTGIRGRVSAANSLVGTSAGDRVGDLHLLATGDYVVCSPDWSNGSLAGVGAATFVSGSAGRSGTINASNSLIGASAGDHACSNGIVRPGDENVQALVATSQYLVRSPEWHNGAAASAGAVTRGSGPLGATGVIGPANSVVGSSPNDRVGGPGVLRLKEDGSFGIGVPQWDRPGTPAPVTDAGAAVIGLAGTVGTISPTTALVGSQANDRVGEGLLLLANGNFVVLSPKWAFGVTAAAGAATFAPASGRVGNVSNANSLIGTRAGDAVGLNALALPGGNYVIGSPLWDRGNIVNAGAATFANGSTGLFGSIFAGNSLMGASTDDSVGWQLLAVGNGNYVVASPDLDLPGVVDAGAVTFATGTNGVTGEVTVANSLTGSRNGDRVGLRLDLLDNGDYLIGSPHWDRPQSGGFVADAGALTRASGVSGLTGPVSVANSLAGASAGDAVGGEFLPLSGGRCLAISHDYDVGAASNAGAATLVPAGGMTGLVSASNSLVGARTDDRLGVGDYHPLTPVVVLIGTPFWDDGSRTDVGALTRLASGVVGAISAGNSLIGATMNERLGDSRFQALADGFYLVHSQQARLGSDLVGAITLGLADGRSVGLASAGVTVFGTPMSADQQFRTGFDARRVQLAVAEADANKVTLLRPGLATTTSLSIAPSPADPGQPVTVTATVSASSAPTLGRVEFRARSGQSCIDSTPTATSATTSLFTCQLVFPRFGSTEIVAEYLGSLDHAYSSARATHTTGVGFLFGDGFE